MEERRLRVSEDRVLKRIYRPKREGLLNVYSSPNIIRVIESRRMRWTRHVVRMGAMRNA
jgi:hypothetical protein